VGEVLADDARATKGRRPILGPTDPRPAVILTVVLLTLGVAGEVVTFLRFRALQSMGADPPYDALLLGAAVGAAAAIAFILAARRSRLPAIAAVGAFLFAAGSALSVAWAFALGPNNIELFRWP